MSHLTIAARTLVLLLAALVAPGAANADAADLVLWPEHHRAFFQDGPALLMPAAERKHFARLDLAGRQIELDRFLADPIAETPANELTDGIEARSLLVASEFPSPLDDRARLLFLHGRPAAREVITCGATLVPIELWRYRAEGPELLLYQERGRGPFELWTPGAGKQVLYRPLVKGWFHELEDFGLENRRIDIKRCAGVIAVDRATQTQGLIRETPGGDLGRRIAGYLAPPADLAAWSRAAVATQLPERPPVLGLRTALLTYPYQTGQRIAARFAFELAGAGLGVETVGDEPPRVRLEVDGILEQDGRVFEDFKFRFDREPPGDDQLALVFERRLRPGRSFVARLRIRDAISGAEVATVMSVNVPRKARRVVASPSSIPVEMLADMPLAGENSVRLVPPVTDGLSRAWRAQAIVSGERIRRVSFAVDGREQLVRTRPPYTADLKLAALPTEQTVSVRGLDGDGALVAEDAVTLNRARGGFAVEIVQPVSPAPSGSAVARAEVTVPEGARIASVEFLQDERPIVALDRPPWQVPVEWGESESVSYLTAVARLVDGRRAEDVFYLNSPDNLTHLDVGLVEVFATVSDGAGRLIEGLSQDDFRITEAGEERAIERFDLVDNLPLVVGIAMDASPSMNRHLTEVKAAATDFIHEVVEAGDRAFAMSFGAKARLIAAPTDDPAVVERALEEVRTEEFTTLYDAVARSLFYFRGFAGRRVLIVLSDGDDTASRTGFHEALRFARESGVVVYTLGLGVDGLRGRNVLKRLAEETGGRYFRATHASELRAAYAGIEEELRRQYFLAFAPAQVSETTLTDIEIEVRGRRLNVRATRGYAP